MNTTEIRQKLHHYIETAQDKKIKAIFAMVEDEIEETYDHWSDESFVSELKQREKEYLEGHSKSYDMDESLARAKKMIRKTKGK